jgi:hypothetical protein
MSFDDGAVHSLSEAKIICVDDETTHRVSLAGEKKCSRTGGLRSQC